MDCGASKQGFKCLNHSCYFCRSCGVVWGRFGATCGPQKPSPERGAAEPGIRKENGERVGTPSGREDGGRTKRTRVERTGENWTKGKGRKGKEAGGSGGEAEENVTELERTGRKEGERRRKHNRGRGTIPKRYARKGEETNPEAAWRTKWRDRREPDARKGKNGKEAEEEHE